MDPSAVPAGKRVVDRKAVLPAAGLGTRFLPATKAIPKEMLPIVDVPTIQLVVEEALDAGIEEIVLVTGRGKGAIEDHFDHAYELEHTLKERQKNEMLEQVQINDPARVAKLYPHQVSGGMGQRVMIAMMLIPEPDLLIADEPTSALDVSVQAQVLDLIDGLVRRNGMGLILISHDLDLVARYCDRILVMSAGRVVEECPAGGLAGAKHPYTRGLVAAVPRMREDRDELPVLDRTAWGGT